MIKLIHNEMMKLLARKRLIVIAIITAILVALFTYAQYKQTLEQQEKLGTTDWRAAVQAQVVDISNRLSSNRMTDDVRERLQVVLNSSNIISTMISILPSPVQPPLCACSLKTQDRCLSRFL